MGDLPRHKNAPNPPRNKPGPAQSPSAFHEGHHEEETSDSTSASAFSPSASSSRAADKSACSDSVLFKGAIVGLKLVPAVTVSLKSFKEGP